MPSFIKTPAQEKKWNEAKKAADKSGKKADDYWALVNHIYQQMKTASAFELWSPMKPNDVAKLFDMAANVISRTITAGANPFSLTEADPTRLQQITEEILEAVQHGGPGMKGGKAERRVKELIQKYAPEGAADTASKELIWDAFDNGGLSEDEDGPPLPDENTIDEMLYRQKWEGAAEKGPCPKCGGLSTQPEGHGMTECIDCRHSWKTRPEDELTDHQKFERKREKRSFGR